MSLSNSDFDQYINTIYLPELDIKDTTDSAKSLLYLDLLLSIDANKNVQTIVQTILYDHRLRIYCIYAHNKCNTSVTHLKIMMLALPMLFKPQNKVIA